MKQFKPLFVLLSILILSGCIFEPIDQNLEGQWSCTETSEIFMKSTNTLKGTSIFPVYIAQDATYDNTYYIDNFYQLGSGIQVTIMISGGTTVTIQTQTVSGIEFSGSGTVSGDSNTINLTYTADDGGGQADHVTAKYTR